LCAASLKEEVVASILGALLLGAYRNGKLRYFGHSGTGFSEKGLADTIDRLKPFFTEKASVENPPKIPEKIQWVQPKLVCEVAFAEWTEDEQLRQTTFLGWCERRKPGRSGAGAAVAI
jgi:bifunctional non-homologous end joining protein LigD